MNSDGRDMDRDCEHPLWLSESEVSRRLRTAIHLLFRRDADLLMRRASERAITHKLGNYVQELFPEWDVDCEYNRHGSDPKKIPVDKKPTGKLVYPDIIVHCRGTQMNLVAVEVKREGKPLVADRKKLRAYITHLRYRMAFQIVLGEGEETSRVEPVRVTHK